MEDRSALWLLIAERAFGALIEIVSASPLNAPRLAECCQNVKGT
jgi:hypothetical protein